MSVLACDRMGCTNIMCDRYSYEYGYLCNECFEELVDIGITNIEEFLDSEKSKENMDDVRRRSHAYYNDIFRSRD